jgi:hypothetical protein
LKIKFPIQLIATFVSLTIDSIGYFWFFIIGCGFSLTGKENFLKDIYFDNYFLSFKFLMNTGFFSAFLFNVKKEDGTDI